MGALLLFELVRMNEAARPMTLKAGSPPTEGA